MVLPISTSIQINASPEAVRKVFFDFPSYPLWSRSSSLTLSHPTLSSSAAISSLAPGNKITMQADGTTLRPTIITNTPLEFAWEGGFWPILKAKHTFRFLDGKQTGTTVLVQDEEFWGLLGGLFGEGWPSWAGGMRKTTEERFNRWNGELKNWVEGEGRRE